jgi:hypothetical protein
MSRIRSRASITAAVVVTIGALGAGEAGAPVPPKNCGMLEQGSKRFNIKADQLRCRAARRYARAYLARHVRPRGYRCRDYGRETSIEFRCSKGSRVFFAIRR